MSKNTRNIIIGTAVGTIAGIIGTKIVSRIKLERDISSIIDYIVSDTEENDFDKADPYHDKDVEDIN